MKHKIYVAVFGVLVCAVLFLAAYMLTEPNETLQGTGPVQTGLEVIGTASTKGTAATEPKPTTKPTQPPTEPPTVPPTQPPTQPPTEPPTEPPEPEINYIVPENYPVINTRECIYEPPVLPIPADDAPEEEWIAFFYGLLSPHNSWYNIALFPEYADINALDKLDLQHIFNNGLPDSQRELTDEEIALLTEAGEDFNRYIYRLPSDQVESIMQIYFGTTLENCLKGEKWYRYFEQTGCYYLTPRGALSVRVCGIVGYTKLDNEDYCVQYAEDPGYGIQLGEVVLRRVGDYFQVVSNQVVK